MLRSTGIRGAGRIGACLAFTTSMLMLTGSIPALAQEAGVVRQDSNGHFSVQLNARDSVNSGDRDGQGSAQLDLDPQRGTACYQIAWKNLDGMVTAFHLHAGQRGEEGPHWIDFFNNKNFAGEQMVSDCVTSTRERIEAVIDDPSAYYLQVHTTAFEKGAIRGQLG